MKTSAPLRYRFGIASRSAAAIFGGYALATAVAMMLARSLPMSRNEAGTVATMVAFLVMPAGVIWCFATRNALRAWAGIVVVTAVSAMIAWLLGPQS